MPFWVYIVECRDRSFYTGHTDDLERRIAEHKAGLVPGYTQNKRPVEFVFAQDFPSRAEALEAELQIKGWSRQKKLALIAGNWNEISRLAKRRKPYKRS